MLFRSYIILWFLFQFLTEISCQKTPFKPKLRTSQTTTLVDNKLYVLGGQDPLSGDLIGQFFYLDVSIPFDTKALSWKDLSSINTVPPHAGAASVKGGADNNTLFLYGGMSNNVMALVNSFDSRNEKWSVPKIPEVDIIRKQNLIGVIDDNGKMYLWSGKTVDEEVDTNDLLILDTINLSWSKGSMVGAPIPRIDYGAVLLSDKSIIYMGKNNNPRNFVIFIYLLLFSKYLLYRWF